MNQEMQMLPTEAIDPAAFEEEWLNMWLGVLRVSVDDYRSGIRTGQHLKLLSGKNVRYEHKSLYDSRQYRNWLAAAHWLLSDDPAPRGFIWLMKLLKIDPETIRSRLNQRADTIAWRKPLDQIVDAGSFFTGGIHYEEVATPRSRAPHTDGADAAEYFNTPNTHRAGDEDA